MLARLVMVTATASLVLLFGMPQSALACHKGEPGIPHGAQTICDGDGTPTPKIVFITSTTYDGALGGLVVADAECQALADAAGLSGTFLAWLSDGPNSPSTTFTQSPEPYLRLDGVMVASSWDDLVDGTILSHIEVDENGDHPSVGISPTSRKSWTGTHFGGTSSTPLPDAGQNCSGWTVNSAASGWVGNFQDLAVSWTLGSQPICSRFLHLYCFEQ